VVSVRFVGPDGADVGAVHKDFVPRNAWIEVLFSAELDPATVVEPAIKVRAGPYFDQPSLGTFHVQGHRVLFDPTLLGNGGARPFGYDPEQTHRITVPSGVPSGDMVRSSGGVAPITTFTMDFRTTTNFVRDDTPPHLVTHRVVTPLPDPSGRLWANTILELEFDEAIDPRTLRPSLAWDAPDPIDSLDVRFAAGYAVNDAAGVAGRPIAMQVLPSADAKRSASCRSTRSPTGRTCSRSTSCPRATSRAMRSRRRSRSARSPVGEAADGPHAPLGVVLDRDEPGPGDLGAPVGRQDGHRRAGHVAARTC
jgi:hypothetical protein